ncbi:MAG: ADP-ribosylglycohydrolase family protein [Eubacteriales bacterium]|nr:ADP-ribosylglycohydrolase family protein [Eubacteriales bacterium]
MRTLKDAIYGLAAGDALGLPVQFRRRDTYYVDKMIGYGTFHMPKGSWSDDTSLAIASCDSIRRCEGSVNLKDIRRSFEDWYRNGAYTPFGRAYDIGGTCERAILTGKGLDDERSNGNGSLMRILPLAFVEGITDEEIAEVSAVTHAHARSQEGCILYIRIAKELLAGKGLKESILKVIPENSIYSRIRAIDQLPREEIRSTGYVVDTFEAAIWCLLTTDNFRDCIVKAVNLGDDTDTVGAVAGGLAGILYGYDGIPSEWIEALQAKDVIESCLF